MKFIWTRLLYVSFFINVSVIFLLFQIKMMRDQLLLIISINHVVRKRVEIEITFSYVANIKLSWMWSYLLRLCIDNVTLYPVWLYLPVLAILNRDIKQIGMYIDYVKATVQLISAKLNLNRSRCRGIKSLHLNDEDFICLDIILIRIISSIWT